MPQGSYGRCFWGSQGAVKGTVAAAFQRAGSLSRFNIRAQGGLESVPMVGSWSPELSEGITSWEATVSIAGVQEWDLLQKAMRDGGTGLVEWLSLKGGYHRGAEVTTWTAIDGKINTIAIRCDGRGRVTAEVTLMGMSVAKTNADPGNMTFPSSRMYRGHNVTWDEVPELFGFDISYSNNLSIEGMIAGSGTVRTIDREPDFIDEGNIDVSGTLRYRLDVTARDVQDCIIASGDHVLTLAACGDVSPAQAATITIGSLTPNADGLDIPDRGQIVLEVPFLAKSLAIAD